MYELVVENYYGWEDGNPPDFKKTYATLKKFQKRGPVDIRAQLVADDDEQVPSKDFVEVVMLMLTDFEPPEACVTLEVCVPSKSNNIGFSIVSDHDYVYIDGVGDDYNVLQKYSNSANYFATRWTYRLSLFKL